MPRILDRARFLGLTTFGTVLLTSLAGATPPAQTASDTATAADVADAVVPAFEGRVPSGAGSAAAAAATAPPVDLVVCLDTSNSMDGLIDSARQRIWAIVNDLALADPTPDLRVGLLTYGNRDHDATAGWVRIDSDLTSDLDLISQRLFALTTNGGSEYVGRVVDTATTQLDWHPSDDTLRLMVVAGNESVGQDHEIAFRDACRAAIARGIMVNAIYCGDATDDVAPGWREVAALTDGRFASIDQNQPAIAIATPFDTRLGELSGAINTTYIPFTDRGWAASQNQVLQDRNALSANAQVAAQRCITKATAAYGTNWDLVAACLAGEVTLGEVDREKLPEDLQAMDEETLAAHVAELGARRAALQAEIRELGVRREAYVAAEKARLAIDESQRLDFVLRQAIREQAAVRGFTFIDPEVALGVMREPAEAVILFTSGPEDGPTQGPPAPGSPEWRRLELEARRALEAERFGGC